MVFIHAWQRGDVFAKRNVASRRSGVVGSTGMNTPATPIPRASHAMPSSAMLRIFRMGTRCRSKFASRRRGNAGEAPIGERSSRCGLTRSCSAFVPIDLLRRSALCRRSARSDQPSYTVCNATWWSMRSVFSAFHPQRILGLRRALRRQRTLPNVPCLARRSQRVRLRVA